MAVSAERLHDIVLELLSRPGHEKVRSLVYDLLVHGLGARSTEIDFERPLPEIRGRADALLGQTVLEFKRDLRIETRDAEEELTRYLAERRSQTGLEFIGIATDGARFLTYELRHGNLVRLAEYVPSRDEPRELLVWLDSAVAIGSGLPPDPEVVRRELGRESIAYDRARAGLAEAWQSVAGHPDAALKRQLWAQLLERVYGSDVDQDELFFQHTYLTVVAKTMATRVLGIEVPGAEELLEGRPFHDAGISGAVESDFFDWILSAAGGGALVSRIAAQVSRFRLRDIKADVLKTLYESLIDPRQRHDLGEYYTPDWLADRVCRRAITDPLNQRVLDPACGSGTFPFHAVRQFLAAADAAGVTNRDALARCCEQVLGIDVHPVAVIVARVTYLLALGEERLRDRPALAIPIYLGDALQWNTQAFMAEREVLIAVPDGPTLLFPFAVTRDPGVFDAVVAGMLDFIEHGADASAFGAWLKLRGIIDAADVASLSRTFDDLAQLAADGRNHIWGYVARNLSRPIWLSSEAQRADVVIGNPPWLSYRYMAPQTQERFRAECQARGLWAGGRLATHHDLSAYFFARSVELYLKGGGTIAFVMPHAAITRQQFAGFRTGSFGAPRQPPLATVTFEEVWGFDERVQPLFPVPSSVIFSREGTPAPLPTDVVAFVGTLPRRDANPTEADAALTINGEVRPVLAHPAESAYRDRFRQGATVVPRVLWLVQPVDAGFLGGDPSAPLVVSRRSRQEKEPWRSLPPIRGQVEATFIRPLYLGESIAPYRVLGSVPTVVPWDERTRTVRDAAAARSAGYVHLASWLTAAEGLWESHGRGQMALSDRIDYHGSLAIQMPPASVRVVYSKAGSQPAAAVLRDPGGVVDHKLYWADVEENEGHFLAAVLNSEAARSRVAHLQSRGQWGARDFDKVIFELPIPAYDSSSALHQELAATARLAEEVAASVTLPPGLHFVRTRSMVRGALLADGVAQKVEALVVTLLAGTGLPD